MAGMSGIDADIRENSFIFKVNVLEFRGFEFQFKLKIRNLKLIKVWPRKKEYHF